MRVAAYRGGLWALALLGASLLLYGALFGFRALAEPGLDIQFHNTYFVVARGHALGFIALLLALLSGGTYLLLTRLPPRAAAWTVGLAALVLLYLLGHAISAVAAATGFSAWALPGSPHETLPHAPDAGSTLPRLLRTLQGCQVVLSVVVLLAGIKLGRSRLGGK